MARPRTSLSDYNPMRKGFPYIVEYTDGSMGHYTIYAHSADDARLRIMGQPEVDKVWLITGKRARVQ